MSPPESPPDLPRLIPPPRSSGFARSFDGTQIYWEAHGPLIEKGGPTPMLFCYGLACSTNQWRVQLARYSPKRPCIVFDYRGHHRSGIPKERQLINLSALGKDASAVIRSQAPDQPWHIWGHSLGASVAIELAAAAPELCRSLILCCGTPRNPFKGMFKFESFEKIVAPVLKFYDGHEEAYSKGWTLMGSQPAAMKLVLGLLGFNPEASTWADIDAYARAAASIAPDTFFPLLSEYTRATTHSLITKVKTPSLVVSGSKDKITPPKAQRDLSEALPNASYLEVPGGSHNVQLDFGDYVAVKAEEFWKARHLDGPSTT